jgi:hypothetical protein
MLYRSFFKCAFSALALVNFSQSQIFAGGHGHGGHGHSGHVHSGYGHGGHGHGGYGHGNGYGHYGYGHHHYGYGGIGHGLGYSSYYSSFGTGLGGYGYRPYYNSYYSSYSGFGFPSYGYSSYYTYTRPYRVFSCYRPRIYTINTINYCPPVSSWPVSTYYTAPTYYVPSTYYVDPTCVSDRSWDGNLGYEFGGITTSATRGPTDFLAAKAPLATQTKLGNSLANANSTSVVPGKLAWATTDLSKSLTTVISASNDEPNSKRVVATKPAVEPSSVYVAAKPRILQPYSPIWTKAAIGLVDDMIQEGRFDDAQASCRSMEKIEQPKGAAVYLRQGLLRYFATQEHSSSGLDEVLGLLDQACASGSQLMPSELGRESLRAYFAACSIDIDAALEKLSKRVLDEPSHSGRELLLLTSLLKLEGQTERARLFGAEADSLAVHSNSFRWIHLLESLR